MLSYFYGNIVQSRLDPNDPANDSLLDILRVTT